MTSLCCHLSAQEIVNWVTTADATVLSHQRCVLDIKIYLTDTLDAFLLDSVCATTTDFHCLHRLCDGFWCCVSQKQLFARLYSYGVRSTALLWIHKLFYWMYVYQTKLWHVCWILSLLIVALFKAVNIGPLMFLIYMNQLAVILENHETVCSQC